MQVLSFVVTSLLLAVPVPESKPVANWIGKTVLVKQFNVKMVEIDSKIDPSQPVLLNFTDYRVLAERGDRIQVKTPQGITGWLEKKDVVVVEEAVAFFTTKIESNPADLDAYNRRARAWLLKGEIDAAIQDFTAAMKIRPSAALYNNRALAWQTKKDYDKAIADYSEALRLSPQMTVAYNNRGVMWRNKKEYDKAIEDFNAAIKIDPRYSYAWLNRGLSWYSKKDYDKAIADFAHLLEIDPKSAQGRHDRGRCWHAKKDYDQAIADYTEAIRLDTKYVLAYENRGLAWKNKKDLDKAFEDFSTALRLNPKYIPALVERGALWKQTKDYEKAWKDFNRALQADPNSDRACNAAAWFLATCPQEKLRDGKHAVELARQALRVEKDRAIYLDTLAAAYAETGAFDQAVRIQEQALQDVEYQKNDAARRRLELYRMKQPYREESLLP